MFEEKEIRLIIDGPGIVLYSPGNMSGLPVHGEITRIFCYISTK